MKWSNCFLKTKRDINEDCKSYELLCKAGLVHKLSAGIYNYHEILLKSIRKLESLVRQEIENIGYREILLSQMHTRQLWEEAGRWDKMHDSLIKFRNRHEQEFCLAGTHEESVVNYVRSQIQSYKDLDIKLYQIQNKFRDELRIKFGLIRGKEFIMKDAYSFAVDYHQAENHYYEMVEAYKKIFDKLNIDYVVVEADGGAIGGNKTHEFQMISDIGDDHLFFCQDCQSFGNKEVIKNDSCHKCGSTNLKWKKGIELGHCFLLGEDYSRKMGLTVINKEGKQSYVSMTCHGIGISRTIQALFEQHSDQKGLIWNSHLSAYRVHLLHIGKDQEIKEYTQSLYDTLTNLGIEVFWDDREEVSNGVKFNDMDTLGFTYQVIVSAKTMQQNSYELCLRANKQDKHILKQEDLIKLIS